VLLFTILLSRYFTFFRHYFIFDLIFDFPANFLGQQKIFLIFLLSLLAIHVLAYHYNPFYKTFVEIFF